MLPAAAEPATVHIDTSPRIETILHHRVGEILAGGRGRFSMATIQHRVLVHAPIGTVYEAIATANGISTWWDKQTPQHTDRGLVLEHNPGGEHGIVQLRVVQLTPERRIEWECISAHPVTSPASAWTGTHFIFDLEQRGAADTEIDFQQTG